MSWTDRIPRTLRRVDVRVATTLALTLAPLIGALVFLFYAYATSEVLEEIDERAPAQARRGRAGPLRAVGPGRGGRARPAPHRPRPGGHRPRASRPGRAHAGPDGRPRGPEAPTPLRRRVPDRRTRPRGHPPALRARPAVRSARRGDRGAAALRGGARGARGRRLDLPRRRPGRRGARRPARDAPGDGTAARRDVGARSDRRQPARSAAPPARDGRRRRSPRLGGEPRAGAPRGRVRPHERLLLGRRPRAAHTREPDPQSP